MERSEIEKEFDIDEVMEEFRKDIFKRKYEILTKLETIANDKHTSETFKKWLDQTSEFLDFLVHIAMGEE